MTLSEHRPSTPDVNNAFPRVYQFYCCQLCPSLSIQAILLTFALLFPLVLSYTHIPMQNLFIPILIFLLQSSRESELSLQKNKKYGGKMLVGDQVALALLNLVFRGGCCFSNRK